MSTSHGRRTRRWSSRRRPHEEETSGMTDRHDGSSIDLEKELVRYMVERPDHAGATCSSGSRSSAVPRRWPRSSPRARRAVASATAAPVVGGPVGRRVGGIADRPRLRRLPQPSPEAELNILNWTDYLADDVISSFEDQYGVKVTQSFFSTTDEMYAKLGDDGGDYDISFPISVDVPNMIERRRDREARQVAPPEHRQPRRRSGRTRATTRATPTRSRTCGGRPASATTRSRIKEDADELEGALGRALEAAHLDARRLAGGLRADAHPAGLLREHRRTRPSSTRRSRCSSSRSRSSAPTRPTRSGR